MAAESAARKAIEHGMRKVDVFVKGPGSGRETAIRSLQAAGLEVGAISDVTPQAAQRTPAAQAAPGLTARGDWTVMARYTGPMTKKSRRLKIDLVGGDQAFERRPFPPGQHGRARTKEKEYLPSCRRSRRPASPTASWRSSSAATTRRPRRRHGKTGDTLLQILESRLDNVVYRAGLARTRRHVPPAGDPRPLPGQRPAGGRPALPGRAVRHHRRPQAVDGDRSRSSSPGRPSATGRSRPGCRSSRSRCGS